MPSWTDCTDTPVHFFGGFAADMGEYTGPWPMMPPPFVIGGDSSTFDQVDFYLLLPNPADPSDITIVGDGTYETQVWDCWRFLNGGTPPPDSFIGYTTDALGGAADPGSTGTPPPGYHLYVVAYYGPTFSLAAPADPPEAFVPTNYSDLGACTSATLPGAWSTWQDGIDRATESDVSHAWGYSHDRTETAHSYTDLVPLWQDALDFVLGTSAGGPGTGAAFSISASKSHVGFFPDDFDESVVEIVWFGQQSATYRAVILRTEGSVLAEDFVQGVDYGVVPWTDQSVDFEDATVDYAWTPVGGESIGALDESTSGHGVDVAPLSVTFRVDLRAAPMIAGTTPLGWYTDGELLDSIAVTTDDGGGSGVFREIDLSSAATSPVAPVGTPVEVTILWGPEMAWTGTWEGSAGPDFSPTGSYAWGAQLNLGAAIDPPATYNPSAAWNTGRWRYQLPETIGPAGVEWHTVGGHWATPGGAILKILTPGVGWVDVVNGPG